MSLTSTIYTTCELDIDIHLQHSDKVDITKNPKQDVSRQDRTIYPLVLKNTVHNTCCDLARRLGSFRFIISVVRLQTDDSAILFRITSPLGQSDIPVQEDRPK